MDAGGLDAVDGPDGAGELAFQRAEMIDVLDEGGGAERVVAVVVGGVAAIQTFKQPPAAPRA